MAFSDFKSINMVIEKYPLRIKREKFLQDTESELPDWSIENLNFAIEKKHAGSSEYFHCEAFIYPFLQEAWKRRRTLQLWSHQPLHYDEELTGEPDYLLSHISRTHIHDYHILSSINVHSEYGMDFPVIYAGGRKEGFKWYKEAKDKQKRLFIPKEFEEEPPKDRERHTLPRDP